MDEKSRSSAGRPRSGAVDAQILESARAVLREAGPGSVNVASVAERSGVARTTIYRRYSDRESLLRAALQSVTVPEAPDPDLDVGEKLRWVVERAQAVVDETIGLGGVGAAIAGDDVEMSAALRSALEAGWAPVRGQIEADVAAGRLASDVDPDAFFDLVLGSYLAHVVRRSAPDPGWQERMMRMLSRIVG